MSKEAIEGKPKLGTGDERGLIEAALGQATPRGSSTAFVGDLPPPDTFPGYELTREVHRGGQGAVYQAIQKATRRRVAIKVMHGGPFTGSSGRARFEREVQILGQLNHPNIVGIHDSGSTADGSFFYVMDYISGRPLDEVISGDKRPTVADTLKLFARICDAVNAAHLRGVIHRDLKPANIRLDQRGEPIVVDFGLAKIAVPDVTHESHAQLMTMTGQFIGSLPWASPEQAEGIPDKIDVRTDVYSLGVILYQMLTGRFPYEVVGNMRDVLDNILRAEPARPSTIRRQVNDEVETIVLKCLAKERDRRYQSAGELARDIHRYLRGEPIEAKRDSVGYVLSKTLRRYRLPVGVAAAFVLLAAGSSVVMAGLYAKARAASIESGKSAAAANEAKTAEHAERVRADATADAALGLSHRLLFDYHESIKNLVGATPMRMKLLTFGRDYITELREKSGDNPRLRHELAEADERIADLLGDLYERKIGKTDEAAEYTAEARRIREELAAADPQSPTARGDLTRSRIKSAGFLHLSGRFEDARGEYAAALSEIDAALKFPSATPADVAHLKSVRAEASTGMANTLTRLAERTADASTASLLLDQATAAFAEAQSYWQDRAKADPSDAGAARCLGVVIDHRARALVDAGNRRRSDGVDAARGAQKQGAISKFDDAIRYYEMAAEASKAALASFEPLSAKGPADAQLKRDRMLALHNIGMSHTEIARTHFEASRVDPKSDRFARSRASHAQALSYFEQALAIADPLASSDTGNLEAQRDLALCLNKIGNEHRELAQTRPQQNTDRGQLLQAESQFQKSLAIRETLYKTDPIQRHLSDRAVAYPKLAQIESYLVTSDTPEDQVVHLDAAITHYQKALDDHGALVAAGVMSPDAPSIRQIQDALEKCQAERAQH